MIYNIRAHHGLCFAFFQGKGYNHEFIENMKKMQAHLESNPRIILLCEADDVCAHCPNARANGCVSEKPETYDRLVLAYCGLEEGVRMHWHDFAQAVRSRILLPDRRTEICGDCQWSALCI